MKRLILINVMWNAVFVVMAASEMLGVSTVHERLPPQGKWIWIVALAGGSLLIHYKMYQRAKAKGD